MQCLFLLVSVAMVAEVVQFLNFLRGLQLQTSRWLEVGKQCATVFLQGKHSEVYD